MADKNRLTCPICTSTFFEIFPAGECQVCGQLVCGHCIQHDHPDHETSICQACVIKSTAYGQLSEMTTDELITIVNDPDSDRSPTAVIVLAEKKDVSAVSALCDALKSDRTGVRRESAKALGQLGSKEAIPSLTTGLKDPQPAVRSHCIASLAALSADAAIPEIRKLINDESAQPAIYAAHAIAELMKQEGLPILQDLLKTHDNPTVRSEALLAISRINKELAFHLALDCLNDPHKSIQISACKILTRLNDPQCIPHLKALVEKKPSASVRMTAQSAINKIEIELSQG